MKTAYQAFIEQTYGSVENARKQDELANENDKPKDLLKETLSKLGRDFANNSISSAINIPTQNPKIKNDNSKYKSCFKNYDHSLEKTRINFKKENDGVEWGDLHDPTIGEWNI